MSMNATTADLRKRLLYILHLGFVEIRSLALAAGQAQIAELADAMEILPRLADECSEEDIQMIRFTLQNYQDKYRSSFDFPKRFQECEPPERY
jgi:hypothetical protein